MPALKANRWYYAVVPFLFLGEYRAVRKLVRTLNPELIYAHWFTPQAIVASLVSRRTRVPFVFTTHASDVDVWRRVPFFGERIVRSVSARAAAITAVSSRSREKLLRFLPSGGDGPPLEVVPMGVPIQANEVSSRERDRVRRELGLPPGTLYMFIGRLVEKKGLSYLLRAFEQVRDDLGDWTLVVAGDGPLRDRLQRAVEECGLGPHVRFVGYLTGELKHQYLTAAEVMVVPSIVASDGDAEGLPVALLEGLSYGLTCIATNESGADDIIADGVNGLLCVQRDSGALAARLREVHGFTVRQRTAMGKQAIALAGSHSWETIARRHFEFLFAPILGDES
jgi:glycosyltransferase involved in cell wall biosynthesis